MKELPAFRRALESAVILLNINDSAKQPYTSGYDSVHDAYNEVWHAWQTAERLCRALPIPSPAQERGEG